MAKHSTTNIQNVKNIANAMNAKTGGPASPGNANIHLLASSNKAAKPLILVRKKKMMTISTTYEDGIYVLLCSLA